MVSSAFPKRGKKLGSFPAQTVIAKALNELSVKMKKVQFMT